MNKQRINNTITEATKKSQLAFMNKLSASEVEEFAEEMTTAIAYMLTAAAESVEYLFNGDIPSDEQCEAVVVDELFED